MHVSQLADRFIKDAHEVVKAGDVVKVRVVDVDIKRKRIALSMRKDGGEGGAPKGGPRDKDGGRPAPRSPAPQAPAGEASAARRVRGGVAMP